MSHFRILGFGHAIVDLLAKASMNTIHKHSIKHGGMTLVEPCNVTNLLKDIEINMQAPGGSTANTIRYLANLGHQTGFIGGIGDDENGDFFHQCLNKSRIQTPERCFIKATKNHFSVICITPESERSMATFINEELSIQNSMIQDEWISVSEYIYVEAYLWNHSTSRKNILAMSQKAKDLGKKIILTLADSLCIKQNLADLKSFCFEKASFVFANHEEICTLMETTQIDEAKYRCKQISNVTWIITEGKHGACVIRGMEYLHLPAVSVPKVIDKTGAGDFFAGGFIHGLLNNKSLLECGISGSKAAAKVIQQIGTRLPFKVNNLIQR
ncbi:MAG: adenosine kinase [Pseudomonadota bacterium]|nr:adenosine kinase [Pseudomonadota bacterium]